MRLKRYCLNQSVHRRPCKVFPCRLLLLVHAALPRPWSSSGRKVLTTDQNLWSVDGIHPSCEGYQTLSETNMVKTHVGSRRRKDAGTRQTAQETTRVVSVEMEEASQRLSANALRFGRCPERW